MTEQQWLNCADPKPMLEFLGDTAGERKLRLFLVGCCRRHWRLYHYARCQEVVETAERYADGRAGASELEAARDLAVRMKSEFIGENSYADQLRFRYISYAAHAAQASCESYGWLVQPYHEYGQRYRQPSVRAASIADYAAGAHAHWLEATREGMQEAGLRAAMEAERAAQAAMLRDLLGPLPFCPVAFDPHRRTPDVVALTEACYAERAFDHLPILADALEDAGCSDSALLTHLRSPGPHVRGCWALDLILGKS